MRVAKRGGVRWASKKKKGAGSVTKGWEKCRVRKGENHNDQEIYLTMGKGKSEGRTRRV